MLLAEVAAASRVVLGITLLEEAAVKNATNAGKSATSLEIAPKVEVATVEATTKAADLAAAMEEDAEVRPVTLVGAMGICQVSWDQPIPQSIEGELISGSTRRLYARPVRRKLLVRPLGQPDTEFSRQKMLQLR